MPGRNGFLRIACGVGTTVLVVLAVASGLHIRSLRLRSAALEAKRQQLGTRVATLAAQQWLLQGRLRELASAGPNVPRPAAPEQNLREQAELLRRISDLEVSLKTASSSLGDLQLQSSRLKERIAETGSETAKLAGKQEELQQQLADANSVVQAMDLELRGKQSRLVPLELSARDLHSSRQAAVDSINRQIGPARAIEDIQRRRETYLNSLLGRYRQLSDQARWQPLQTAARAGTSPAAGPDLSRVQSVVSQAEEEQRQIEALDAQAQLVLDRMQKLR